MTDQPAEVLNLFLTSLGSGDLDTVRSLLAADIDWEISGAGNVPWAGHHATPDAALAALTTLGSALQPQEFSVDKVLADDADAVAFGRFTQKVIATGATFTSEFALRITVAGGKITRYRIHEDSHAVSVGMSA